MAQEQAQEPAVLADPPPRVDGDPEAEEADPGRCPSCQSELPADHRNRAFAAARRSLEAHFHKKLSERFAQLAQEHAEFMASERAKLDAEREELVRAGAEAAAALIEQRRR